MDAASTPQPVRLAGLKEWMISLLVKQGMFAAEAEMVALRLIASELMERPAGGVRWLPRLLAAMDVGDIDPRAKPVTVHDLPNLTVIDGGTGVGQSALHYALGLAVRKVQSTGSTVVAIRNSRPVGDPTACLHTATIAGCLAGIMMSCKRETEPWPIGPCSVWGHSCLNGLITSTATQSFLTDSLADAMAAGSVGTKTSRRKKKLFADDAEYLCFVTDLSQCGNPTQLHQAVEDVVESAPPPLTSRYLREEFWPETAQFPNVAVNELRDLAKMSKVAAEW